MTIDSFKSKLQNIMRNDEGVNGEAQRIEQMVWLLFLKVYDDKESLWEFHDENYISIIPEKYRWRNWAVDNKDGKAQTGDELQKFVNEGLIPTLKDIDIDESTPISKAIVKTAFENTYNYMKNGILLRQVINVINSIDFTDNKERHQFNDIYETILKDLQNQRASGEFYTPRAVTDFIVAMVNPKIGDRIADFACGTGGFLTSALNHLSTQIQTVDDKSIYSSSVFGIEKKSMPYLLAVTNLFLHDIDEPYIIHGNSLNQNVREFKQKDKFDTILMNPPYGGSELDSIKMNFPSELRSSETADLFMSLIMYRLKKNGKAAVVLPEGFLFGTDNSKMAIKEKLMKEFNLHTIIRLPHSVFAPYTPIHTNILFFDNTHPTEYTWFYRLDMPEGYKNFSKTKSIKLEHFEPVIEWSKNREEIVVEDFDKSKKYTAKEIIESNYNLDLCGFPKEEKIILDPKDLMENYQEERTQLNKQIDNILDDIHTMLGDK